MDVTLRGNVYFEWLLTPEVQVLHGVGSGPAPFRLSSLTLHLGYQVIAQSRPRRMGQHDELLTSKDRDSLNA